MKRGSWKAGLVPAVLLAVAAARPAAAAEGLALRRVLLSSGGVGYFEYEGAVHHDADLPLTVPLDQVDDVLKSVVVYDSRGSVGEITLPGKASADGAFRELPFDAAALGSEPDLLDALRGAEVVITTATGRQEGRILSITSENTVLEGGSTVQRHRLALEAGGSVSAVILEDAKSVTLADPTLQHQVDAALASLLDEKARGRRTLLVHSAGSGDRTVRVGYVVAVPLWKSTYRLTLPADPLDRTAALQGWAVVENQSGVDWKDVDLTLTSGNPVTFRQALYAAYYVDRPEIPVEVVGRVLPRLEEGAQSVNDAHAARAEMGFGAPAPAFAAPSAPAVPGMVAPPAPAGMTPAETTEDATQVVFHLPAPVTLASTQEGLLPVIARSIPAERVSLYQPDVDARHPLASIELHNDGDTGLPPGVVTTYERAAAGAVTYLGDARVATMPSGEKRLLSFGVDPKVTVDRREHEAQAIALGSLADGVMTLTRTERRVTEYTLSGAAHEPRTVILDHPRVAGFALTEPTDKVVGVTEHDEQIRVEIPAGATVSLKVVLERPVSVLVTIADLTGEALGAYATSTELPPAVRQALAQVAALRATLGEKTSARKDLEGALTQVKADQARVRDDLKAVPSTSALAGRYLDMMAKQEDRIAELEKQISDAQAAVRDAEKALAAFIRSIHG